MADNGIGIKALIGILIVIVIIAAGTSYGVMTYLLSEDEPGEQKAEKIGPTYSLGDFVVNLSGTGGYKYIKASIVVEVDKDDVVPELEERSPQIRDMIIDVLRDQKLEDLEEPGTTVIKNQIRTKINNQVNRGQIKNVWFTQLVIQ